MALPAPYNGPTTASLAAYPVEERLSDAVHIRQVDHVRRRRDLGVTWTLAWPCDWSARQGKVPGPALGYVIFPVTEHPRMSIICFRLRV